MKIHFLTYCDEKYESNRRKLNLIAKNNNFNLLSYSPSDIDQEFFIKNYDILSQQRGIGYWLWKPYFIKRALSSIEDNEVIFYLDCGDTFTSEISSYINTNLNLHNIILVPGHHQQKLYTKRDCFVYMNCDTEEYWNNTQLEAGIILLKKTDFTIKFINEWLSYCEDKRILTDIENTSGLRNFDNFIDHRHDQSILTNLSKKYNIMLDYGIRKYIECNIKHV